MIEELKKIDRNDIFKPVKKNKVTFFEKILMMFGYGKKR
jgi:hypothetical protein